MVRDVDEVSGLHLDRIIPFEVETCNASRNQSGTLLSQRNRQVSHLLEPQALVDPPGGFVVVEVHAEQLRIDSVSRNTDNGDSH